MAVPGMVFVEFMLIGAVDVVARVGCHLEVSPDGPVFNIP
jgi:hypothetical protein